MVLDDAEKFEQKNITNTRVEALLSRVLKVDRQNCIVGTFVSNYSRFSEECENTTCTLGYACPPHFRTVIWLHIKKRLTLTNKGKCRKQRHKSVKQKKNLKRRHQKLHVRFLSY